MVFYLKNHISLYSQQRRSWVEPARRGDIVPMLTPSVTPTADAAVIRTSIQKTTSACKVSPAENIKDFLKIITRIIL